MNLDDAVGFLLNANIYDDCNHRLHGMFEWRWRCQLTRIPEWFEAVEGRANAIDLIVVATSFAIEDHVRADGRILISGQTLDLAEVLIHLLTNPKWVSQPEMLPLSQEEYDEITGQEGLETASE